jgi:hypothetical protein
MHLNSFAFIQSAIILFPLAPSNFLCVKKIVEIIFLYLKIGLVLGTEPAISPLGGPEVCGSTLHCIFLQPVILTYFVFRTSGNTITRQCEI